MLTRLDGTAGQLVCGCHHYRKWGWICGASVTGRVTRVRYFPWEYELGNWQNSLVIRGHGVTPRNDKEGRGAGRIAYRKKSRLRKIRFFIPHLGDVIAIARLKESTAKNITSLYYFVGTGEAGTVQYRRETGRSPVTIYSTVYSYRILPLNDQNIWLRTR